VFSFLMVSVYVIL